MLDKQKLFSEWETDCKIEEHDLSSASLDIPKLHAKYLRILDIAKNDLREMEFLYAQLLRKRMQWYDGELSKEEMDELEWPYDPYNGRLIKTKGQKEFFYKTDDILNEGANDVAERKDIVSAIESMIENIRWRNQTIKNSIDFQRFMAGG